MTDSTARQTALAERDSYQSQPTSLVGYSSNGQIAVLGTAEELARCAQLPSGLSLQPIAGQQFVIEGYLGNFKVEVSDANGQTRELQADAILDLHHAPLLTQQLTPPGYYHWPSSAPYEQDLGDQLQDLVGEFDKPKFFTYDASICAHAVNGNTVCRNCIDACPADAITSAGATIEVNPHLCQGGGSCTSVCPSGAIRYVYPTLRDNGMRLRKMLQTYTAAGGERPMLLFHAESCAVDRYLDAHPNLLPVAVEELASVGPDLCLAAVAYGAAQVVLLKDADMPAKSIDALERQLEWLRPLLVALELEENRITLLNAGESLVALEGGVEIVPALNDMPIGKREAILRALDHLVSGRPAGSEAVELPASAPFGAVTINGEKCTLCMACVGACPGRALQDGSNREIPEVFFIEANCLQCGACVTTCPEDAVTLHPRLLFDHASRIRARSLNRDQPFACISCGKPFAPASVIDKMLEKLKNHHMFSNQRALDRLKMCEDCRVVDIVDDPAALGGQFDPLGNFSNKKN